MTHSYNPEMTTTTFKVNGRTWRLTSAPVKVKANRANRLRAQWAVEAEVDMNNMHSAPTDRAQRLNEVLPGEEV